MIIHQLEVRNFRGFEYRTFNLSDQFTALIGDNGFSRFCFRLFREIMRQQDITKAQELSTSYPEWFKFENNTLYAFVGKDGATSSGQVGELVWSPVQYYLEDDPIESPGWDVSVFNLDLSNRFGEYCGTRLTARVFVRIDKDINPCQWRDLNLEASPSNYDNKAKAVVYTENWVNVLNEVAIA